MTTIQQLWPTCAVCNRPVATMTHEFDPVRMLTKFTASCHGQTETTTARYARIRPLSDESTAMAPKVVVQWTAPRRRVLTSVRVSARGHVACFDPKVTA